MTADPNSRLLEFADRLRQHRIARTPKITGKALAEMLGWGPMKVSLIERGRQPITEPELTEWARALGVSDDERDELLREMQAIRLDQARWKARIRTGGHEGAQRSFAELEQAARKIACLETAVIPGLVQTPGYARAVFEKSAALRGSGHDVDAAVAARMQRQQILYDETKTIELLVVEAALRSGVAPSATMAGQIDRLVALTQLPNVRFGIVPAGADLPAPAQHGFWLFDDELLYIEVLHTELTTRDPDDVQLYRDYLAGLWAAAVEGERAGAVLQRVLGALAHS